MQLMKFHMHIAGKLGSIFLIDITHGQCTTRIAYSYETRFFTFLRSDRVSLLLQKNLHQFRKLLHNKRPESYYAGFQLYFVLRDEKDVEAFNNKNNILVVDYRGQEPLSYTLLQGKEHLHEIYTDGSYLEKLKTGGYAALIKHPDGLLRLSWGKTHEQSNNLIELLAAIQGLKALAHIPYVRIISDSRYVIKGLAEWVINWKMNNWYTANGDKVKNIAYWKEFDALAQGKYIEFYWVKGHNNHPENTLCDYYARQAASRPTYK